MKVSSCHSPIRATPLQVRRRSSVTGSRLRSLVVVSSRAASYSSVTHSVHWRTDEDWRDEGDQWWRDKGWDAEKKVGGSKVKWGGEGGAEGGAGGVTKGGGGRVCLGESESKPRDGNHGGAGVEGRGGGDQGPWLYMVQVQRLEERLLFCKHEVRLILDQIRGSFFFYTSVLPGVTAGELGGSPGRGGHTLETMWPKCYCVKVSTVQQNGRGTCDRHRPNKLSRKNPPLHRTDAVRVRDLWKVNCPEEDTHGRWSNMQKLHTCKVKTDL